MRRHHVASTLIRRHFCTKCPLGQISTTLFQRFVFSGEMFETDEGAGSVTCELCPPTFACSEQQFAKIFLSRQGA